MRRAQHTKTGGRRASVIVAIGLSCVVVSSSAQGFEASRVVQDAAQAARVRASVIQVGGWHVQQMSGARVQAQRGEWALLAGGVQVVSGERMQFEGGVLWSGPAYGVKAERLSVSDARMEAQDAQVFWTGGGVAHVSRLVMELSSSATVIEQVQVRDVVRAEEQEQ